MSMNNNENYKNLKLFSMLRTKVAITKELGIYLLGFNVVLTKYIFENNKTFKFSLILSIISFIILVFYLNLRIKAQSLVEQLIRVNGYNCESAEKHFNNKKNNEELWHYISACKYNNIINNLKLKYKLYYYFYCFEILGIIILFTALILFSIGF